MSYYDVPRTRSHQVLDSDLVSLDVRQQPQQALVTGEHKEKTRKAVDPPPIVQLRVIEGHGGDQGNWLVNPFLFMNVQLVEADPVNGTYKQLSGSNLLGTTVSSCHRLKDINNRDGGFFVFGDISCRKLGVFRLQFNLFDLAKIEHYAVYIASVVSQPFQVVTSKDFRGQMESTHLSRAFSDQGVRLRLRKEQRTITGSKRGLGSPPRQSLTPSVAFGRPEASPHDRPYGFNAPKRQRSDSDYTPQLYQTQHPVRNPLHYGDRAHTGSHTLPLHHQQGIPMGQAAPYGSVMGQSHETSTTIPNWQGNVHQDSMAAPIGSLGNTYFSSLNTMSAEQRHQLFASHPQQQGPSYPPRTSEHPSNPVPGFHIPTSLSDTAIGSHEPQSYMPSSADLQSQAATFGMGSTSYAFQHQQSPAVQHGQFGLRMAMPNSSVPGYEPRAQTLASGTSHEHQLQMRGPGQYDQAHFTGGEDVYPESARDTLSSSTAHLSDTNLPLDSGVLNRGFMPPYTGSQPVSPEQNTPDFKEPPYPTPH